MKIKKLFIISLALYLIPILLMGQGRPYEGPEDAAGDPAMEREGWMNGNRFRMAFNNNTQIADYPRRNTSKWPDNDNGTKLIDVCAVEIGAEVYLTQDTIPVTDPAEVVRLAALGELDTLIYLVTQDYPDHQHVLDHNWDNTVEWALAAAPGYMDLTSEYPAMSNRPDSWPPDGWPSTGFDTKWQGEWFGRYGRGLVSASLETYFVANDAQDQEYIIDLASGAEEAYITDGPRYYPRRESGVVIGDFARPGFEATTQIDRPWGGLGLRVEVRGYQWNNDETKDMIFWEYNIANISDYDILKTGFGYHIDPSIGGDTGGGDGETAYYNTLIDLTYIWEITGIGAGGRPTGVLGIAYLESPGKAYDGVDNDDDGLVDERRDNPAGNIIGAKDNIANLQKFMDFYNITEAELRPHFEGDEDQDWYDGIDANGNGTYAYLDEQTGLWNYEPGETANDDVGLDGVGPLDINYTGPDEGECNHQPDYVLGVGSEPNFAAQDVSEADQLGLTTTTMLTFNTWGPYKSNNDENVWSLMISGEFDLFESTNYMFTYFASADFPLYQGKVERISIAMIAAYDELTGLNNPGVHSAPRLFKKKENAQVIYERDYQFAKPPLTPTLTAYPGDGQVTLVWDDMADKFTREPLLKRVNDFEGYKLYRSTDKYFQDSEIITTAYGIKKFRSPIFQCDKQDSIMGLSLSGILGDGRSGTAFNLGEDTGLSHSYVDHDVQNGRTYYYVLTSYDYGIESFGIAPAESFSEFDIDSETDEIIRVHKNMAVVTPRSVASGYIPPYVDVDEAQTSASIKSGEIIPEVISPAAVKANHTYRVTFGHDTMGTYQQTDNEKYHPMDMALATDEIYVYDVTEGNRLVYSEWPKNSPRNNVIHEYSLWEIEKVEGPNPVVSWNYYIFAGDGIYTDIFDGLQLTLNLSPLDTSYVDVANSGWETGSSKMAITTGRVAKYFPWDYSIIFTDTISTQGTKGKKNQIRTHDDSGFSSSQKITDHEYNFYVVNNVSRDANNQPERLDLVIKDEDRNGVYDFQTDTIFVSHSTGNQADGFNWSGSVFAISFADVTDASEMPQPGDIYHVRFIRPKTYLDSYVFTVAPEIAVDKEQLKTDMERIKVVPNPYFASNAMEPAVSNQYLNQRRRIMFTHLPANCMIRIFTPVGFLVDQIDVMNHADDGIAHWDLLTKEDLEIAAGMYVYQVTDNETGNEKVGKFAVIK